MKFLNDVKWMVSKVESYDIKDRTGVLSVTILPNTCIFLKITFIVMALLVTNNTFPCKELSVSAEDFWFYHTYFARGKLQ